MGKKLQLLYGLAVTIFAASCGNKDSFSITGRIINSGGVRKIYLLVADSAGIQMTDSTTLSENAEFTFKGTSAYPVRYKLRIGSSVYDLIVQNGETVNFLTDLKDPEHKATITGSTESTYLQEWGAINDRYSARSQQVLDRYQEALQRPGINKDSVLKVYTPLYEAATAELAEQAIRFAKRHKNSLAGFYAITSLDHKKYETALIKYADEMRPYFKNDRSVLRFLKEMDDVKPVSVGQKAPEFQSATMEGKKISLSNFKGQYVMIDFWASWCPPCRQENPNLVKLYQKYHRSGLQIIGVSLDTEPAEWQQAIKADGLRWMQLSDRERFDGPTEKRYHIEAIPANFIIDPKGTIVAKDLFGADLERFLAGLFDKS